MAKTTFIALLKEDHDESFPFVFHGSVITHVREQSLCLHKSKNTRGKLAKLLDKYIILITDILSIKSYVFNLNLLEKNV